LSYTFIFHKQFYFISGLNIICHGNPDNNLESPCTTDGSNNNNGNECPAYQLLIYTDVVLLLTGGVHNLK